MARSNFSFRSFSSRTRQLGQGMSEYLIIVAMIAIAAIGVVSAFGETVQGHVSTMTQELAGNDVTSAFIASGAARAVTSESSKTLADYASTN